MPTVDLSTSLISATDNGPSTVRDGAATTTKYLAALPVYFNFSTSTTVYSVISAAFTGAAPATNAGVGSFYAVRIA
jgi:hypothetical protein